MKSRYHKELTRESIDEVLPELMKRDIDRIVKGNLACDRLLVSGYQRELHVDRVPFSSHEAAWDMGCLALVETLERMIHANSRRRYHAMFGYVGRALHILQDLCSHSNLEELSPASREAVLTSFLASGHMPVGLRICSFSIGDLFRSGGKKGSSDEYTHREHHHDLPNEVVRDLAYRSSVLLLQRVRPIVVRIPGSVKRSNFADIR